MRLEWSILLGLVACAPPVEGPGPVTPPPAPVEAPPPTPWLPGDVAPLETQAVPSRPAFDLDAIRRARWTEAVAGWVALSEGATLHATAAAAEGSGAAVPPLPTVSTGTPRGDAVSGGMLLKVVADRGAVVEVETPSTTSGHCGRDRLPLALHRFALTAFVRKRDLALVVNDAVEVAFRDGTGVSVAPGVPVGVPEVALHAEPAVAAGGFSVELPIPVERIGLSYAPDQLLRPKKREGWLLPSGTAAFRGRPWLRLGDPYYGDYEEAGENEDGTVIHLGGSCLAVWVLSPEPLRDVRGGGGGMGGIAGMGRGGGGDGREPTTKIVKRTYSEKGAEVQWPDGSRAGEVRARFRLHDGALSGSHCFTPERLDLDQPLCLPPKSYVVEEEEVKVWR